MPQPADSSFVGSSAFSAGVRDWIALIGSDDCNAVIQGPSGSGKRIVLQALQAAWGRGELVRIPAVQLDGETMRSELAGYRGKSFTGGDAQDRKGLLAEANGGIMGVDEADHPPEQGQAYLVDITEKEELWPVGVGRPFRPDVRVVMCVHEAPEALVERGWWRRDLFYRVSEEILVLLPLLEHMEDVPDLTDHLLHRLSRAHDDCPITLARSVLPRLMAHPWPGNVRELDSVLKRACRRARHEPGRGQRIAIEPRHLLITPHVSLVGVRGRRVNLSADQIVGALEKAGGSIGIAATDLNVSTQTLRRRIEEFGIDDAVPTLRVGSSKLIPA